MTAVIDTKKETYFSNPERLFPELEEGGIPTERFLFACQGVSDFVGMFLLLLFYIF